VTAITDSEWISRDAAAVLAGCSSDSIKRDIAKHDLDTQLGANQRVTVRLSDLVRIGRVKPHQLPGTGTGTGTEGAELRRARSGHPDAARRRRRVDRPDRRA
jgi:hypothetical protein